MNQLIEQFSEQHLVAFMLTLGRIAGGVLKHTAERESEKTLAQLKALMEG